jgi:hypothetical protein
MERALGRLAMMCAGLVGVSLLGLPILHARYESSLAPLAFVLWTYVPCAVLTLGLSLVLQWDRLWRVIAALAIASVVVVAAIGGWQTAYWLAVVPWAGAIAATVPQPWGARGLTPGA